MKPSVDSILRYSPELDPASVERHIAGLPEDYFDYFPPATVSEHIRLLQGLNDRKPVEILLTKTEDGQAACTVLAFDFPAEFSVISGLLAGYGFSIVSGHVYTYARQDPPSGPATRTRRNRRAGPLQRRCIVDHFSGRIDERLSRPERFSELGARLRETLGLMGKGDKASIEQAKRIVNMAVVSQLEHLQQAQKPVLYPMEITMDEVRDTNAMRLRVVSQDTPAFLYALSNTLAMQQLSIERLRIRTVLGRIEDEIEIVDRSGPGRSLADADIRNRIRLSVLLTKQFTYFLPAAPDPFSALSRFDQLVGDIVRQPDQQAWLETVSDPHAMRDLARVLGASDFLWEDFIRLQYESLLPLLRVQVDGGQLSTPVERIDGRLDEALAGCTTHPERIEAINRFKDREVFLIDLDHILRHDVEFKELSRRLTRLAEVVVGRITELFFAELERLHGSPQTVGGLAARYAVMGLGKLGGVSLGYASDIELLYVYSDAGRTSGEASLSNAEFFATLAREATHAIAAKREGIFEVDLRLRPHGRSGPLACSLESFCKYYGPGGAAHSYERLALVRMRAVAGHPGLGERLERLRDEFVYGARSISLKEIHELRARQAAEKYKPGVYNAKFSPGGLVDLEYTVQLLQVEYGADRVSLRTPRIHQALAGLREIGVLEPEELERLVGAYDFLRRLINGLRMLRGSAKDLFLPAMESDEFLHLARRMGYDDRAGLLAAEQLHLDFETRTASVRAFVERQYGRDSLPGPASGNVADVLLSRDMDPELALKVMREAGFDHPDQALGNLRSLAGTGRRHEVFVSLAVLACDHLRMEPAPCMALNNWERYVAGMTDPLGHFDLLLAQPRRLDILLGIFSRSQFLANTLTRHPEYMNWVTDPGTLQGTRARSELEAELAELATALDTRDEWVRALCRFREREILRIGTRDMILRAPVEEITRELSVLAEVILEAALRQAWKRMCETGGVPDGQADAVERFYLLGLGKLGGVELNYSSDIDLIAGFEDSGGDAKAIWTERGLLRKLLDDLHEDLTRHTTDGAAYRIDFRLRPYGASGEWVQTTASMIEYYTQTAALWEIQAMLKARVVAGGKPAGEAFMKQLRPILQQPRSPMEVAESIQQMREAAVQYISLDSSRDVKTGVGGIRDIEFLVQGFQLVHMHRGRELCSGNTLAMLRALSAAAILPQQMVDTLEDHYVFLRRVEHYLQILDDRQIHSIPSDEDEIARLARRLHGPEATSGQLLEELNRRALEVRNLYDEGLECLKNSKL